MTTGIILNGDKSLTDIDVDVTLSKKLDDAGFSLGDTVTEMQELMIDAKAHGSADALKTRLDLIKHAHTLHGSKASKANLNIGIFMHPAAGKELNY